MAAREIEIPDFDFSKFYYAEILQALIEFKRRNVPELTDESDFEPYMQLLRAFALVGHSNNVLTDLTANEFSLITARLPETVRNQLRLIEYEMTAATPAVVDVVYELNKVFAAPANEILPVEALASTKQTSDAVPVDYEALTSLSVDETDVFTKVWSVDGGVVTDHTTEANTAAAFTPWPTMDSADALYFAHKDIMWDELTLEFSVPGADFSGVWEFYDGDKRDAAPTSVVFGGGLLTFDLTSLLGTTNRQGTQVTVTFDETGTEETVASTWTGAVNVCSSSLLGQSSPSEDELDYSVGTVWTEFANVDTTFDDETAGLAADGAVKFALPQTELLNWQKTQFTGSPAEDAFIIRFRVITASIPTSPTIDLAKLDDGKQYVISTLTQGRSVSDDPLGSSDGTANLQFDATRDNFISQSEIITVDAVVWTRVLNFLASVPASKHYVVELGENDRATFLFGDGVTGKIPDVGSGNISADYRFNAELDGNVGARKIEVDGSGLSFVNKLFNPRNGNGWRAAQSASDEGVAQAKQAGPASIRNPQEVACGPDDLVTLVLNVYVDAGGAKPFSRAFAIEEGFGPKTVKLVCALGGGGIPSSGQLDELDVWVNGDKNAIPPLPKRFVVNSKATATAFSPKIIDVSATVEASAKVTEEQIKNALSAILQTDALKDDGITFEWDFGVTIPVSRLEHEIHSVSPEIKKVTITQQAGSSVPDDTLLLKTELPVAGVFDITMVVPSN
jgi:hypothetical protein